MKGDLISRCEILKKAWNVDPGCGFDNVVDVCDIQESPAVEAIALPCAFGTRLWRITTPYRGSPKVTEFVVKNFRTIGKKHQLQIEVQALNTPGTNWMRYQDFYKTREEAEAALQEKTGGDGIG